MTIRDKLFFEPADRSIQDLIERYPILNIPISLHGDPSKNLFLDFFNCVHKNLIDTVDTEDQQLDARGPIIQAICRNNEDPPQEVDREKLVVLVPHFMEELAAAIRVMDTFEHDFTPDGDGKAFHHPALALARFKELCARYPLPPAKASFQDTTLRALDH